ncbi:MAG: type IV pilin biogenesis protein [Pirellulaceae bacterium]|nr:MAG: type IV pilin biogenesis protein [Pirellulaceae bacterium]
MMTNATNIAAKNTHQDRTVSNWRSTYWWCPPRRAELEYSLLQLLQMSVHQRLDLAKLVRDLAGEHRWRARRQLHRLANHLSSGLDIAEALQRTPGVVTDATLLQLQCAVRSGTLPAVLEHLEQVLRTYQTGAVAPWPHRRYLIGYAVALVLAVTFLGCVIAPIMHALLQDSGQAPPAYSQSVLTASQEIANRLPLIVAVSVLMGCLWWGTPRLRHRVRRMHYRMFGASNNEQRAVVLETIVIGVRQGRPLPSILSALAYYHYHPIWRQRLLEARNEIEQGADQWDSLRRVQLLTSDQAGALAEATDSPMRTFLLEQIALQARRQAAHLGNMRSILIQPLVVVAVGLVVAAIVAGFFNIIPFLTWSQA